jgi:hypothetical protein
MPRAPHRQLMRIRLPFTVQRKRRNIVIFLFHLFLGFSAGGCKSPNTFALLPIPEMRRLQDFLEMIYIFS